MSKFVKLFLIVALLLGTFVLASPSDAKACWGYGGFGGYGWGGYGYGYSYYPAYNYYPAYRYYPVYNYYYPGFYGCY